jgi:Flp pilus assembly pilin Flp
MAPNKKSDREDLVDRRLVKTRAILPYASLPELCSRSLPEAGSHGYRWLPQLVQEFVTLCPNAGYDYLSSGGVSRETRSVPQPGSPDTILYRRKAREEKTTMFIEHVRELWCGEEGQDIAEYAVMLAVILVIVVGTVRLIGSNANTVFSSVASAIQ